jgi:hypothetical protein
LTSHKKTHTGDKPYECHVYNKRFSELHKLTQHKMSAHKGSLSFECDINKKTARKLSHNVKISNVTGDYIQEMAYYSATVVAWKLFKNKDLFVRY